MTMPTPDDFPVRLEVDYPEGGLSRLLLFIKWLLIIPHALVLIFFSIGMSVAIWLSWWVILFTGRYPRSLFDLVVGVQEWSTRVNLYNALVTDRYPPFSTRRPMGGAVIVVIAIGVIAVLGFFVFASFIAAIMSGVESGMGQESRFGPRT